MAWLFHFLSPHQCVSYLLPLHPHSIWWDLFTVIQGMFLSSSFFLECLLQASLNFLLNIFNNCYFSKGTLENFSFSPALFTFDSKMYLILEKNLFRNWRLVRKWQNIQQDISSSLKTHLFCTLTIYSTFYFYLNLGFRIRHCGHI